MGHLLLPFQVQQQEAGSQGSCWDLNWHSAMGCGGHKRINPLCPMLLPYLCPMLAVDLKTFLDALHADLGKQFVVLVSITRRTYSEGSETVFTKLRQRVKRMFASHAAHFQLSSLGVGHHRARTFHQSICNNTHYTVDSVLPPIGGQLVHGD